MKRFSDRIISLRNERRITQTDLANVINKQRSTVSGYETGGKEPDYDTLCRLAEYFDVTVDYLLGRDEERKHADVVFRNDNTNFKKHYDALPPELKPVVTEIFDDFYVLLNRDMRQGRAERLRLYRELIHKLQASRAEIKNYIESNGGNMEPLFLSELMELQNAFKNEVCAILDQIMQADLDYVLNVKKGSSDTLSRKSAT
ncbi:helix-turn-helix transcriptional regulator [Clostridium sp. D33t1_170424_F3]|uniref:helix-turn-helix domain-containing protein n=1 Tax=Clostridium sp. D33t1_170424_F3 TaxID=2787099 RepID=UPI0018AC83D8|nr:helix-turn-helix transcriptional regulator [Clostridium sp. D33t1_170424_F3]